MKWSGTDRPVLVIGYGNSLRLDDGAGLALAARLVESWQVNGLPATLLTSHQLEPELADDIAQSNAGVVVFVDAAVADGTENQHVQATQINSSEISPSLGHHLTPAAVMLYASELYSFAGDAWIISVPGYDFDHGEGLSATTQALVDGYALRPLEIWDQLQARTRTDSPKLEP